MTATVKNELEELKANVISLSRDGKYGEAVRLLNGELLSRAYLMSYDSDDLDKWWSNFWCGFWGTDCCCKCSQNECVGLYCVSFITVFFCCGEDVASSCCGCDWMIDSSSSCVRDQCC